MGRGGGGDRDGAVPARLRDPERGGGRQGVHCPGTEPDGLAPARRPHEQVLRVVRDPQVTDKPAPTARRSFPTALPSRCPTADRVTPCSAAISSSLSPSTTYRRTSSRAAGL